MPLSRGSELSSVSAPAWSPDGTLLAVEVIRSVFYDDYNHWMDYASDLYVLGTAPFRALTTDGQSRAPSWSPDGTRIAFVKRPIQRSGAHIYILDVAGGDPVPLTPREGSYETPRWSPDGASLAFSDDIGGNRDVFIVNADGTGLTNVTANPGFDADPRWSPDGTRLAFVSDRYGKRVELFVVGTNGGNAERLTSLGGWISAPVWSPDGRLIAFTLAGSPLRPSGVYVMYADGSSLARLISTPANALDLAFAWQAAAGPTSASVGSIGGRSIDRGMVASSAANTPLAATMQFGQTDVGSDFPPAAEHDESSHAKDNVVPRTVVIDRGGTVTFAVPAGVHQIAIYAPGKAPEDINTGALIPLCPGSTPRIINDPNGRVALITHACGSAWQSQYTFNTSGRYLVICAFLTHFQVGMYGWVEVRDRDG
jgi:Tol biopolymer transport system component/plastocyanin